MNDFDESALEDNVVNVSRELGEELDEADEIEAVDYAEPLSRETQCSFLTGSAGTGKTFTLKQRIMENPYYAVLSASTGIAAVNLNTVTVHSLLGFFDTDSLRDAYLQGAVQRKLRKLIGEGYHNVVIDEISMVSSEMLDLLVKCFDDVNANLPHGGEPIGLVLCGDFCQLPPIPDRPSGSRRRVATPWSFEARTWPRFTGSIEKLTKVWRQGDAEFLAALNYARRGRGAECAGLLANHVEFHNMSDRDFDGTTILSQNAEVDRTNALALDRVRGRKMLLPSRRWGKQRSEWKIIPPTTELREGCYVMLLANTYDDFGNMIYANGDCGHVLGIQSQGENLPPTIAVELVRNGQTVGVGSLVRGVEVGDRPNDTVERDVPRDEDEGEYIPKVHYRGKVKKFVVGQIEYFPIRLAYASTCHKVQGLSLDRVQLDFRGWMWGTPAMLYTALSRCRNMPGLRLIGDKETLARKIKVDPKVLPWL